MPTALVTGANRGLGLEHVRQFAARGFDVIAAARSLDDADELGELAKQVAGVRILPYDAGDLTAADRLRREAGDRPIDILLANAGVMGGDSQSFDDLSADAMMETFKINTVAPVLLAKAFVDNVAASARRLIALQSSQMGSIADASAGFYAYRASKSALNMMAKAMAGDLRERGVTVISLHPGWVRTRMGGPGGRIDPEESVKGEQALFDRVGLADSGKFFRYSGEELPW